MLCGQWPTVFTDTKVYQVVVEHLLIFSFLEHIYNDTHVKTRPTQWKQLAQPFFRSNDTLPVPGVPLWA
jgi:hypothetical protein